MQNTNGHEGTQSQCHPHIQTRMHTLRLANNCNPESVLFRCQPHS